MLLLVVGLVILVLTKVWLQPLLQQIRQQERAVAAVESLGAEVDIHWTQEESFASGWLPERYSKGLGTVFTVNFQQLRPTISNADFERLELIPNLQVLVLRSTLIEDSGLANLTTLEGMKSVKEILLTSTRITDSGLATLSALPELNTLYLAATQITDAGLDNLRSMKQLSRLRLDHTQVTDLGLEYLKPLTTLQWVDLTGTRVTREGIEELKAALPNLKVTGP